MLKSVEPAADHRGMCDAGRHEPGPGRERGLPDPDDAAGSGGVDHTPQRLCDELAVAARCPRARSATLPVPSCSGSGRGLDTRPVMMPEPSRPWARTVWPTTASAQIVKRWPGAKNAGECRLADILSSEFDPAPDVLASVLTCCDMTTSPDGQPVRVDRRLAEIHDRYGPGHLVSRSIQRATPMILRAVEQVHDRAARSA